MWGQVVLLLAPEYKHLYNKRETEKGVSYEK